MADNDQNHDDDGELDGIDDDDAERLLADAIDSDDDERPDRDTTEDSTDWRAEADKWKRLSRQNEKTAKERADKLREYEDKDKSESQRLQEALGEHQTRAEKAEAALRRREVAEARAPEHATVAQIKAVAKRLHGDSDDDLETDADELFGLLAPEPRRVASRPQERLRGGGEPDDEPEETDPRKLADLIPRNR